VHEYDIIDIVKVQFRTNRGNKGIVLRDINDDVTGFTNKIMAFKLLRKCGKEEDPTRVITFIV